MYSYTVPLGAAAVAEDDVPFGKDGADVVATASTVPLSFISWSFSFSVTFVGEEVLVADFGSSELVIGFNEGLVPTEGRAAAALFIRLLV